MNEQRGRLGCGQPAISALLPWYVNGSIDESERRRIDSHLSECALCRDDLAQERRVYQGMTAETNIAYMPAASLKRLQARLDGTAGTDTQQTPTAAKPSARRMPWQAVMAASIAVIAVALSLLAADRWVQFRGRAAPADYYTVTTPAPHASGEVIRAVFSPAITLVELQAILDEAQLRIVAGPSEAGVYSLAPNSQRPAGSALALLRAHPQVRFAERTQSKVAPGAAP
jgi:anti-sigma-K factor RskA